MYALSSNKLLTFLVASCFLAQGCGNGSGIDKRISVNENKKLPYDLYLSGTFTTWSQNENTLLPFDAERGVYYLNNIKAGPSTNSEPRRFKLTGQSWSNQFGFGPNNEGTRLEESSVNFAGDSFDAVLSYFSDSKDIYIPLDSSSKVAAENIYLDFEIAVIDAGNGKLRLSVRKDLPPLSNSIFIDVEGQKVELPYMGDNIYRGTMEMPKGVTELTVTDGANALYRFKPDQTSDSTGTLHSCNSGCGTPVQIDEAYVYRFDVSVDGGDVPTLSITKLSYEEAKQAAPHFDASRDPVKRVFPPYPMEVQGRDETVKVSVKNSQSGTRVFTITSTQPQREDKPQHRLVSEHEGQPQLQTGDLLFDALFALAVDDMRLNSVTSIKDSNYNSGRAIPCNCFETGEKWNYVWTRDLSYAADLSLAHFDPARVVNSLLFKTSDFRQAVKPPKHLPSQSLQIIQDTGSGGSWPVSTDRVTWALAAESTLHNLSGENRRAFIDTAYTALRGTIEADRVAAFDQETGLYGGEQSYLDWRTQTYAPWIVNNLSYMAESKALSTNVAHYQALRFASKLAEIKKDQEVSARYREWAEALKRSINKKFWLDDVGLYSSLTTAAVDQAAVYKYDMLGNALAIRYEVASPEQARSIMQNYPHADFGVPVYYPQQPNTYVYHNRALWPFVTGYALRAGAKVENTKTVNNAIDSLIRGAALNLSNMENLEWLTGKPWFDDGPAINSRRQLWSVAAYLGMVTETMFGYKLEDKGILISPFLTSHARKLLGQTRFASLKNLTYKDSKLDIELHLPEASDEEGFYHVDKVTLNGVVVRGTITDKMLTKALNRVEVYFGGIKPTNSRITMADRVDPLSHVDPKVFSPAVPDSVEIKSNKSKLVLVFEDLKNQKFSDDVIYNIYRDGKLVAEGLTDRRWQDPQEIDGGRRYCYAVEAKFLSSGHRSHHSEPECYEEHSGELIPITDNRVRENFRITEASAAISQPVFSKWGAIGERIVLKDWQVERPGVYAIQLIYNNRQHTIDSGVTNAVKQLIVVDKNGKEIGQGIIQMPNVADQQGVHPLKTSSEIRIPLAASSYSLILEDYFNMSYLESNSTYSGSGGAGGPVNKSSIAAFKLNRIGD